MLPLWLSCWQLSSARGDSQSKCYFWNRFFTHLYVMDLFCQMFSSQWRSTVKSAFWYQPPLGERLRAKPKMKDVQNYRTSTFVNSSKSCLFNFRPTVLRVASSQATDIWTQRPQSMNRLKWQFAFPHVCKAGDNIRRVTAMSRVRFRPLLRDIKLYLSTSFKRKSL